MIDAQPSKTALRVAMRRAAHQFLDVPPVFEDPLALRIVGRERADAVRATAKGETNRWVRHLRAFLAVRHRVAEDALARGIARGVTQYVVLGAGLDTFAYRNTNAALRIFEIDAPATQLWKRGLLQREGIAEPSNLTFVPVNFETQSLAEELERAGLDTTAPTIFAWLGVTMYLTTDATLATLRYIASVTKHGGGVVFDYAVPPDRIPWWRRWMFARLARRVKAAGEPFIGFFDTVPLIAELRAMGFTAVEDLNKDVLNQRYFANRADGLGVGPFAHIMTAFR